MPTPSEIEVIESCLIEKTKVGRCNAVAKSVVGHLEAAGYAIVPKEPTREMWAAGADAVVGKVAVHHDKIVGDAWRAMLQAYP